MTISQIGDLEIRFHAAEALLQRAARTLDDAEKVPSEATAATVSIAVAEAKLLTTEIAILAANKLFELAGTQSTFGKYNLDRHWRNARTHTLHDPVRWKYYAIGNYYLNNVIHHAIHGTNWVFNLKYLIQSDEEAIRVAQTLAADFALDASGRDQKRRLPYHEIERYSLSGVWGITVPKEYGGADVSVVTLAEVVAIISAADPSLGQIPQNHYFFLQLIRTNGSDEQKGFFYDRVLRGQRLGNALSESGTKTVGDYNTRVVRDNGAFLLTGRKFYSTGALFAHWIPVVAKDENDYLVAAFVERGTPGLEIVDDWDSFGQRTTGSGTVILENVRIPELGVMPYQSAFDEPTALGPVAQIIHAAAELGIARAAIGDTIAFVRQRTRPWIDAKIDYGMNIR